jgi:transcriptional regulator with XRE-family HTH domain
MNIVITELGHTAKRKSISASALAKAIGVDPSYLSHVRSGRIRPGLKFYTGVVNAFPELKPFVDEELYGPTRKTSFIERVKEAFK